MSPACPLAENRTLALPANTSQPRKGGGEKGENLKKVRKEKKNFKKIEDEEATLIYES